MSWFSKMVNYFTGETETDKQLEKTAEEKKQTAAVQAPVHKAPVPKPNPKTKVAYQYPEGNFRFPIIPDNQKVRAEPRGKSSGNVRRERSTPEKRQQSRKVPARTSRMDSNESSKRTFHPTEIPSPIYGFRPRDNQEPLEYRISPRSHENNSSVPEGSLFKSFQRAAQSTESVLSKMNEHKRAEMMKRETVPLTEQNIRYPQSGSQVKNRIEAKEPVLKIEKDPGTKAELMLESSESEEKVLQNESITSMKKIPFKPSNEIAERETGSEYEAFEEDIVGEHSSFSNEEIAVSAEATEEKDVVIDEQVLQHILLSNEVQEHDLEKVKEDAASEYALEELKEDAVSEPAIEELYDETPYGHILEEMHSEEDYESPAEDIHMKTPAVDTEEKRPEEIAEDRSTKSKVPFNVMMFGRDKQKLTKTSSPASAYQFPSLQLLNIPPKEFVDDIDWLREQTELLNVTLENFNVKARVVHVTQGPAVTRLEVQPEPGVKVNKITNLTDDIKLSLSAKDIRIEAPIPGKNRIGIEVPNRHSKMVYLREILRSADFRNNPSPLTAALGLDISGQAVVTDLKKMPHGLIAGATGSGKSVCINTILVSLLYKASPHEVKLLLIDPKMVELAPYQNIPHLVSPVITDVKAATGALKWAVEEMERRYELFAHAGARDISRYNELAAKHKSGEHLPYIVIVIDELADLMMVAPADVEEAICRIAQKARACGIHLIVATQRPSVDVITGLIKSNIPTRIAFSVSSQVDSRTIIDSGGAEKLLGKGDMLFLENGTSKAVRIQGNFVSDEEIERVVDHAKKQMKPHFLFEQEELMKKSSIGNEEDELLLEACEYVVDQGGASTSSLQRRFRIGYNRAARLMDMMEKQGIISEARGSKPREVLITEEDLEIIQESGM
ncbi:DNA translocase FtsK [Metabacillus idriensis]|uniref:DNA translocase FtsK n=1 Tax=Metabacillus idriensis TaxID=324768 RepID=UPI00174B3F58|nr:DNA translocase FtsK [Metabacillus idriensis]